MLCIRVHGVPGHRAIAQVRGPGTRKTVKFDLGSDGVANADVMLRRSGVFTVDVKGDDQPDFLQFTARVPSAQLAARTFSCS